MCSANGPFKLCTCNQQIDRSNPYWLLRQNRKPGREYLTKLGQCYPAFYFKDKQPPEELILDQLNSNSVFDFDYKPKNGDILELYFPPRDFFVFKFKSGSWKKLANNDLCDNLRDFEHESTGFIKIEVQNPLL